MRYSWVYDPASPRYFLEQAVRIAPNSSVGSITDVTAQTMLETQLLQAQKLDALGQLTGGVAHDFNNLLAAIMGGLELLGRRLDDNAGAHEIIAHMRQAAQQGETLVKSLLSFARKQPLLPTAVDPAELEEAVLPLAKHALGNAHKIEWKTECGEHQFYVDRSQLTLALLNLIINARDAMPDGGAVKVRIEQAATGTDPRLRIAICDEGTGIPEHIIDKITEPFFTTKPAGKGTGLGLSAVAGFVEQSGGTLNFKTPAGGGTCVEIVLPTAQPN